MKLAKLRTVQAALKVSFGYKNLKVVETNHNSRYSLDIYTKDSLAFHDTHIINLVNALEISNYITYDKDINKCVLHLF